MATVETTHYIIGSVVGPHPFPRIVRDFQSVIGRETIECCNKAIRETCLILWWRVWVVAAMLLECSIPLLIIPDVRLVGIEAGGRSSNEGEHAAPLTYGTPGILHGSLSYVLQDLDGQTADVHSVSAGLGLPRSWVRSIVIGGILVGLTTQV